MAVLGLGVLFGVARYVAGTLNDRFRQDAETLLRQEWSMRSDSVRRVLVLGSSNTECAVADRPFFAQQTGGKIRVAKLFRRAAGLTSYDQTQVFELLTRYPPDVLCLEENLLMVETADAFAPTDYLAYLIQTDMILHYLTGKLKNRTPASPPDPTRLFQGVPAAQINPLMADTVHLAPLLTELTSRPLRRFAADQPYHKALASLAQRGTRLVILRLPLPAPLQARQFTGERGAAWQSLLQSYEQTYGFTLWETKTAYPFRLFFDNKHLNAAGSHQFSTWLARQLLTVTTHGNPALHSAVLPVRAGAGRLAPARTLAN